MIYLFRFIKDLNLKKVIIFAHSLGGPIGIKVAEKCEDKVQALILSESNLDKSTEGTTSYEFGTCSEEDFVNEKYYEVVKNAGHFMTWENPKGLAEAIKKGIL